MYEPRWKRGTRYRVKASVAVEELERLAKEQEEPLRPQDVVDAARPVDAVLHPQFTWDDGIAAEKWRCREARETLHSLVYVEIGEKGSEAVDHGPVFVSVVVESGEQGYMPTRVVMESEDLKGQAVRDALVQLQGWKKRHRNLKELSGLFSAIDSGLKQLGDQAA